jgi:hypothetical protein
MPSAVISPRGTLLQSLSREIGRPLQRFGRDGDGIMVPLPGPNKLRAQAERLSFLFEQGAPLAPPLQQRLNALARLRRGASDLSRREWGLIAWGLCDDCGASGLPIEEPALFDAVMAHTDDWIASQQVPRKGWFGLLNSYFSYQRHADQSRNWLRLRHALVRAMPILVAGLKRPKLWSRMLAEHPDIFTDDAGHTLHRTIFFGTRSEQNELDAGLPIPEISWLWRRIVAHQINYLNALGDSEFMQLIPAMLSFLSTKPLYADHILAALLTRYCQSSQRAETHELLKNESFARWGNPQLRGSTRWASVEAPVRNMVLRWFAKDDLEHFFSLLQGNGQVDQARLRYWLRFVDQISYTRILLGAEAMTSPDPEFRNFRAKNAARCGQLTGGPGHNNAFVMRINDHYIVEFSGTGNACYAYAEQQLPFNPNARTLHTMHDLKHKMKDAYGQVTNTITHRGSWQWSADQFLAHRGIRPGMAGQAEAVEVQSYQPKFIVPSIPLAHGSLVKAPAPPEPATKALDSSKSVTPEETVKLASTSFLPANSKPSLPSAVKIAVELARINRVKVQDNLAKGGAFWVLANDPKSVLGRELVQLGMTFNPGKGFWIK